jgi:hypothetical protein
MLYHKGNMMRDPIWFKEFEREYNEREDRIAELKEKNKPAKKQWVGLTSEEIWNLSQYNCGTRGEFARAIEAKLKEKNSA